MNTLVEKMSKLGLLKVEWIAGTIIMAIAMIALPVGILVVDVSLLANPFVFGVVLFGIIFLGLIGYFSFIRPYVLYCKLPKVLAETDGEFLYIHLKKEAKIPLAELSDADVRIELPYLLQKEFLNEIIIHLFSEEYGNVVLEIPNYGTYKMRFVANVKYVAEELAGFISQIDNNA